MLNQCIKTIFALLTLAFSISAAFGQPSGNTTPERAARFFHYREWISAGALYTMLLGEKPDNPTYAARAIVSAGMLGDTTQQISLTHTSLDARMPVDSLFTAVEQTSFSIGQTSLYEQYLLLTKAESPWLARVIDSYLMRYYAYRRNPQGMIDYSLVMLKGNPENEKFLYTLAQGYLLDSQTDKAIDVYRHILSLNPQSLDALLYLANYHYELSASSKADAMQALDYFRRAASISSTPYISTAIERLHDRLQQKN